MGLLDFGDSTGAPKGLMDFLQSPQAMTLAASLLKSGGYTTTPTTLGQALGTGMDAMQASANQSLDNQFKKVNIQNTKSQIAQRDKQIKAADDFNNFIKTLLPGQGQQPGAPLPPSAMPPDMMPMGDANGNLQFPYRPGAQMPQAPSAPQPNSNLNINPTNLQLASILASSGDMVGAANALQKSQEWGRPFSAVKDGKPVLMQQDKYGNTREVPGVQPLRTGTSLSFNNGNLSFSQGAVGADGQPLDSVVKDPRFGSTRAGAGGTYYDKNTGQTISTNTNQQTSIDQQITSSHERMMPLLDDIVKNVPQFQHASKQAASFVQSIGNKFFNTHYDLPNQQAAGEKAIYEGSESFMKEFNLPNTNEALNLTRNILTPNWGETEKGYRDRVDRDLRGLLIKFNNQANDRMQYGHILNNGGQGQTAPQVLNYDPTTRSLR
jgi:hypothetical protein